MTKLCKSRMSRQSISPERPSDSPAHSARLIPHILLCVASLLIGFSLSRELLLVADSFSPSEGTLLSKSIANLYKSSKSIHGVQFPVRLPHTKEEGHRSEPSDSNARRSLVHVGRHEILIRPWPHPDTLQTLVANQLLKIVQEEQRHAYGLKHRKKLIAVTPTYATEFQRAHLTCLIYTLRNVPAPVTWIVVEAGGVSNATDMVLLSSQLSFYHLGLQMAMPYNEDQWSQWQMQLRLEGLRFIREQRLDGIVIFVDEGNAYSLDFFDEVQRTRWVGAFSIGPRSYFGSLEVQEPSNGRALAESNGPDSSAALLQGPVCNSTGHVVGWYIPVEGKGSTETGCLHAFDWSGLAFNAKLLWEKYGQLEAWQELFGRNVRCAGSAHGFVRSALQVEPLGGCGQDVLLWWRSRDAGLGKASASRSVFVGG